MIAALDRPRNLVVGSTIVMTLAIGGAVLAGDQTLRGVLIGVALGLVNVAVGTHVTRRALNSDPGAVMVYIVAGFAARFALLVALMFAFTAADAVSAAAFAFSFLALVFVYFAIEFRMVFQYQARRTA